MTYNRSMANKGMVFESVVISANRIYERRGLALVQKISTPWKVTRKGKKIVSAHPEGKSTLDFRGTVKRTHIERHEGWRPQAPVGISISFDCKETTDETGLPLKNFEPHQIDYMETALAIGEVTFILCSSIANRKRYFIPGQMVVDVYRLWEENKRKRGFNLIPYENMLPLKEKIGITIDYLQYLRSTPFEEAKF